MPTGSRMAASDVPVALTSGKPASRMSDGTMMMPPPMPNSPAKTPAAAPMRMSHGPLMPAIIIDSPTLWYIEYSEVA